MLRCAADPGHHSPEEKLKVALRQADKYETDADGGVAETENVVARQDPAKRARAEL